MSFADKIIQLRKERGWSQEELAHHINVTRQSVSKWESEQSTPDLEKILQLSQLFEVTTDYLLKDEPVENQTKEYTRHVSMQEAMQFLDIKKKTLSLLILGVGLCIVSPIPLMILGVLSEHSQFHLSENIAAGIGLITIFILCAIAVGLFVYIGGLTGPYEYLEKEIFILDYGVKNKLVADKEAFRQKYNQYNIIGTTLCVLSAIPLFCGAIISENNEVLLIGMLSITIFIVAIAVCFFLKGGSIWASYEKLLQTGDYHQSIKKRSSIHNAIDTSYWLIVTAIYLVYSFMTYQWHVTWIVWVVAGILYPVLDAVVRIILKEKKN